MDNKSDITSSAKLVENEKSKKAREDIAQAEADAKARKKQALDARKSHVKEEKQADKPAKPIAEKKKTKAQKKTDSIIENIVGDVGAKGVVAGVAVVGELVKAGSRASMKKTLIVMAFVVVFAVVIGIFLGPQIKDMLFPPAPPPPITVINELTDAEKAELLKNKAIEIQNIIIGESRQRKELMVLEQDVQVDSQWESSWGNLAVFSKTKKISSFGTGYFNVDLSGISEGNIIVDHTKKTVLITVPHAFLKSISIDEGKTQYEDTQKGLLSFGDLKLTMEQQSLLKESIEKSMRDELESPDMLSEADKIGKLMVGEIYQPLVTAISDEYYIMVEMDGTTSE